MLVLNVNNSQKMPLWHFNSPYWRMRMQNALLLDSTVITASRLKTVIFRDWRLDSGRFVIFLAVFLSVIRLYFAKLLEGKQPTLKIILLNLLICLAKDLKWNIDSLSREDELFKHSAVSEFCCSLCFPSAEKINLPSDSLSKRFMEKLEAQPDIIMKIENEVSLILSKWCHSGKDTSLMSLMIENGSPQHGRHLGLSDVLKRLPILLLLLLFFSSLLFYY